MFLLDQRLEQLQKSINPHYAQDYQYLLNRILLCILESRSTIGLMIAGIPNDRLQILKQLVPGVKTNAISINASGNRLAMACSDKTIRMFVKKDGLWVEEDQIIRTANSSARKISWVRIDYGTILLVLTEHKKLYAYQWKLMNSSGVQKYEWEESAYSHKELIEDFKVVPGLEYGMAFSSIDGGEGSLSVTQYKLEGKQIAHVSNFQSDRVFQYGSNCHSWSKHYMSKYSVIAVGGKSHETTNLAPFKGLKMSENDSPMVFDPRPTLAFYSLFCNEFNGTELTSLLLKKISKSNIRETHAVNDISWAPVHGRSYHLLAVATDNATKIYQVQMKQPMGDQNCIESVDALKVFPGTQGPSLSLSWNYTGTILSIATTKKNLLIKNRSRGVWEKLKELIEQQ